MPSYVHKLYPDQPPEFDDWVFPSELKATTLLGFESEAGKLVLIRCLPNNEGTTIYERPVSPSLLQLDSLEEGLEELVRETDWDDYTALVRSEEEHITMLENESIGALGLVVRHTVFVTLN